MIINIFFYKNIVYIDNNYIFTYIIVLLKVRAINVEAAVLIVFQSDKKPQCSCFYGEVFLFKVMELIIKKFKGVDIVFDENGWVNATQTAKNYNRDVRQYLRGVRFNEYAESVQKLRGVEITHLKNTVIGKGKEQGIYLHPFVAVEFARWISSDFAVQMDMWFEQKVREEIKFQKNVINKQQLTINELIEERDNKKWWMND